MNSFKIFNVAYIARILTVSALLVPALGFAQFYADWDTEKAPALNPLNVEIPSLPKLKVLSWNIGQSKFNSDLNLSLERNLNYVISANNAPDLISLIETRGSTLKILKGINFVANGYDKITIKAHSKTYQGEAFTLIWKSSKLKLEHHKEFPLKDSLPEFNPPDLTEYKNRLEHIEKTLPITNKITQNGFEFSLVADSCKRFTFYPVHFTNIWTTLETYLYAQAYEGVKHKPLFESSKKFSAEYATKAILLKSIILLKDTPHYSQVSSFLNQVKDSEDSLLVAGDFNVFPRLEGSHGNVSKLTFGSDKAVACRSFEKTFQPIYPAPGEYSFPSQSFLKANNSHTTKLLIDYAYARGSLWKASKSTILPLIGSDHYPVFIEMDLQ